MDLYDGMNYVYTVYKEKSFTSAAKKLFISQPSLSASVRRVEEKLGYPIFDRTTKPVTLTEYGRKYIDSIERIMEIENDFSDYLSNLENLRTGKLVFGGSSLYSSWFLPPILAEFNKLYPDISLEIREEDSENVFRMVQENEIDFFIENYKLSPTQYETYLYGPEYILLAVPKSFEVNDRLKMYQLPSTIIHGSDYLEDYIHEVPIREFADYPFILVKPNNHTRVVSDQILQANHMHPKTLFEVDQQMTAYNITSTGLGISFVSDTLVNFVPDDSDIIYYKLDMRYASRSLYFCWKAGRYMTRAMQEFLKMLNESRL